MKNKKSVTTQIPINCSGIGSHKYSVGKVFLPPRLYGGRQVHTQQSH